MKSKIKGKTMKKIGIGILSLLFVLVTLMGALAVPSMPHQVYGQVKVFNDIMPFYEVKLSVCDYRKSSLSECVVAVDSKCVSKPELCRFETDSTGSYIFEMANINPGWRPGDLVKLDVCDGNPNCEVITALGDTATEVNFVVGADSAIYPNVNEPAVQTIEKERVVYVPDPKTSEELAKIKIQLAGVNTDLERFKAGSGLKWWHAFILMIVALMAGLSFPKARKMASTLFKKNNQKAYGR